MIDLHIHTTYSDGANSLKEVLQEAESLNLEVISITDHDNCNSYKELRKIDVSKYYNGKIIPGIEIKCSYGKRLIEVLGYNIDTEKMQNWSDEYYKDKSKPVLQEKYFNLLYDKCLQMGLKISDKQDIDFDKNKNWASLSIYNEIKKHSENEKLVPEDFWSEFNGFSKKYCGNPEHILFIDKTKDYPTIEETIDTIRKCNGLVFLPHLFIYKWAENKEKMIDDILNTYEIDGIECMHSEFTEEQIQYLLKLCKERNYYMSGGSDYHGVNKPGISMAVGKGNMKIPLDLIKDWNKI